MTNHEQEHHDMDIWNKAIDSLDMNGLPDPPHDASPVPLTDLSPSEQAASIWYAEDDVDRWWRMIREMPMEQPDFGPNHIKSKEQLYPGLRLLYIITEDRYAQEVIITDVDTQYGRLQGFNAVLYRDWEQRKKKGTIFSHFHSYADDGLIPHGAEEIEGIEGKWAKYNHLALTGDSLTAEELEELNAHTHPPYPSGLREYGPFSVPQQEQSWIRALIKRVIPGLE